MGQSTNAILFYGYELDGEDGTKPWKVPEGDDEGDWEHVYGLAAGLQAPLDPYPDAPYDFRQPGGFDKSKWTEQDHAIAKEHSQFWADQRLVIERSGCEIGTHCSGDYPMYYAAVSKSEVTAHRGSPVSITSLVVQADWDEKIKDFCAKLGIDVGDKQPGWWLVSYWD